MAKNDDKAGGSGPPRGRPFRPKRLKTSLPRPEAPDARPLPTPKVDGRIAKVMARAGVASRREAEALIEAGRVSVNGEKISSPALNVTPKDRITIDGVAMPQRERTRLFLFHKPRGVVTTSVDTHDRPTIYSVLPEGLPRLISVGRLDINTEGLLLLTNDGGLARALELPETGWLRRYRVRAFGTVTQAQLDGLKDGIEIDGVRYGAIEATFEREQGSNVWLSFAMREGKNREIRNVLRELGLHVNRLIRVSYGPFQLGELVDGAVEEIRTRTLRDQIGERLAALAGADFTVPMLEQDEIEERPRPRRPDARPKRSEGDRFEAHPRAEGAAPQGRPDRDDRVRRPAGDRPGRASGDTGGRDERRAPHGKSFEKKPFEKSFDKRPGGHKPDRAGRGPDRERGAPSSFHKPDRQGQRPDREGGAAPTFQKQDRRRGRFDLERGAKPSFDKPARPGRDHDRSRDAAPSQGRPDHASRRPDADRGEGRPFRKPEQFGRKPDRERGGGSSFGQSGRFESRPDREGGAASPSRKPGGRRRAPDRGKSSGAKPSRVKPAAGKSFGDKSFGGKPAGGKPFGDRPSGGKPFGGRPSGGRPAGGKPGRGKRDR